MPHRKEVVPHGDAEFDRRFTLIAQVVAQKTSGNPPAWTHVPKEKAAELAGAYTAWAAGFAKTAGPHTPVDTAEKNAARAASEPVLRKFIQRYLYADEVSEAERESMELPHRDHVRTVHGVPTEHVKLEIRPHEAGEIRIDFWCAETDKSARPDATYNGALLFYKVLEADEPIPAPEALHDSEMMSRSPHIKHFDGNARGKRGAFSAAWENGRGWEGVRCPVEIAIIP